MQTSSPLKSVVYTTNDFVLLADSKLSHDATTTFIQQNPAKDSEGLLESYDLSLKWPVIEGTDSYKLTLYRNNVPYTFTLSNADYNGTTAYWIRDTYNATTQSFPIYTGAGDYRFGIQYCFADQCSGSLDYDQSLTVGTLPLYQLWGQSNLDASSIPAGLVKLQWDADPRASYFKLQESRAADGYTQQWQFDVPRADIQRTGPDANGRYQYTHYIPKTQEGAYLYSMQACTEFGCSTRRLQDEPGTGRTRIFFNDGKPTGLIDPYQTGSDVLTGYAMDKDGTNQVTDVILYANGKQVFYNGALLQQTANLYSASAGSNHGFKYDNFAARLAAIPGMDFNQPIALELVALDKQANPEKFETVANLVIANFENSKPVAADDQLKLPLLNGSVGEPRLNLIVNDYDPDGQGITPQIVSQPSMGSVTVESAYSVKYTPGQNFNRDLTDTFTYKLQDTNGGHSNTATVTLTFADLAATDDVMYVDWQTTAARGKFAGTLSSATSSGQSVAMDIIGNDLGIGSTGFVVNLEKAPSAGTLTASNNQLTLDSQNKVNYQLTSSALPDQDCFEYSLQRVSDNKRSNNATACINRMPKPVADSFGASNTLPTFLDVTANDVKGGVNAANLKPVITSYPASGFTAVKKHEGYWQVMFTPGADAPTSASFSYKLIDISDRSLQSSATATVNLTLGETSAKMDAPTVARGANGKDLTVSWKLGFVGERYQLQKLYSELPINTVDADLHSRSWVDVGAPVWASSTTVQNLEDGHYFFRVRACQQTVICGPWAQTTKPVAIAAPNTDAVFTAPDSTHNAVTTSIASDNIGTLAG